MSGGMPELGSKISLISKADIRYEGRLYTVDPQECTIALSSVRSFGTEDRETQYQIAPQTQIYDYILFRGSDIKDIRVVNNSLPHPNDPAIMQVQLPNGQHIMPHFPMPSMNPPPPMGGGAYVNPFGGIGLGTMGGGAASGAPSLAPGTSAPGAPFMLGNQQQQQKSQQQQQQQKPISVIDMLTGASRSTTPISIVSRKSPSVELQINHQPLHQNNQQHQNNVGGGHGGQSSRDAGQHKRQQQQRGGGNTQRNSSSNNDYYQHQQRDRRDSGRNNNNNMDNNNYNNQHHDVRNNYNNQRPHQGGGGGQNRSWTMHRGGPNNPNNMMMRNRGGGGRGRMPNQGYRPMGGPGGIQNKPRNPKNAIKFEQDFDFEQANNKFEELRSQLSKLKVGDEPKPEQCTTPPNPSSQMNGETDKKDDSGNETGAGEHEPEDEEIHVGYDKTKSFFDNISCEAAQDRSKNKKNDWRQERKLNSETFGVSSTRRGSYRGRGNYYNRNIGNYGGGGYNRNYRGGNNYNRNRSNNRTLINNASNGAATNSTTANNTPGAVSVLKNQAQQPQTSSSSGSSSTTNAGAAASATVSAATKSLPQENNVQPSQVAAQ